MYKLFRLKVELNYSDVVMFLMIEEEIARKRAIEMQKLERSNHGNY